MGPLYGLMFLSPKFSFKKGFNPDYKEEGNKVLTVGENGKDNTVYCV